MSDLPILGKRKRSDGDVGDAPKRHDAYGASHSPPPQPSIFDAPSPSQFGPPPPSPEMPSSNLPGSLGLPPLSSLPGWGSGFGSPPSSPLGGSSWFGGTPMADLFGNSPSLASPPSPGISGNIGLLPPSPNGGSATPIPDFYGQPPYGSSSPDFLSDLLLGDSPIGSGPPSQHMADNPFLVPGSPLGGGHNPLASGPPSQSMFADIPVPDSSSPDLMQGVQESPLRSQSQLSTSQLGDIPVLSPQRQDSVSSGQPPPTNLDMHPAPTGRSTVPFGRPSQSHDDDLTSSDINQRVMTLGGIKNSRTVRDGTRYTRHKDYAAHQTQRLAQMRSQVTPQTARTQSVSMPKQDVRTETFKTLGTGRGLTMTGMNASGFYSKPHSSKIPKYADYQGYRDKQMLSQLSEIMMYSAEQDGHKPVEVQFGYGKRRDGSLDLYASANQAQMQNWLEDAMKKPVGEHIQRAANSGDKELQIIADKLLWHQEQTRARTAKFGSDITSDQQHDLDTSTSIFDKFLTRDLTVVKNTEAQQAYRDEQQKAGARLTKREQSLSAMTDTSSDKYAQLSKWIASDRRIVQGLPQAIAPADQTERHAEQNIAKAIHGNSGSTNPYEHAEVQGSKIRCEGCSSELGHELINQSGQPLMGKAYPTQASTPRHGHSLDLVTGHNTRFSTGSNRPRSHSIPNLPAYVPPSPPSGGSSGSA